MAKFFSRVAKIFCCVTKVFCCVAFFFMHWFSSESNESTEKAEWPPKFQSFEEYKDELDEAVKAHPPFGVWLRQYRNVNHVMSHELSERSMWELPVQKLKERYVQSTKLINNTKNAKRAFIEMHLDENKATYEKDESELQPKMESYALALDSYNQALLHGYHNIPRPKEPRKTSALLERDKMLDELKKLVQF